MQVQLVMQPHFKNAYDMIVANLGGDDEWLNQWAYANLTYYPMPKETDVIKYKGTPLANIDQKMDR